METSKEDQSLFKKLFNKYSVDQNMIVTKECYETELIVSMMEEMSHMKEELQIKELIEYLSFQKKE